MKPINQPDKSKIYANL